MHVERVFLDANVIVYAHDSTETVKRTTAMRILRAGWDSLIPPSLSIQVLQEVHVTLLRKGVSMADSIETVRAFLQWNVVENRKGLFVEALELQQRHQLSFWDASILAAAKAAEAVELWTEDFQDGRDYDGILVRNPFSLNFRA